MEQEENFEIFLIDMFFHRTSSDMKLCKYFVFYQVSIVLVDHIELVLVFKSEIVANILHVVGVVQVYFVDIIF